MKVTINGKVTKEAIASILAEQKEKLKSLMNIVKKKSSRTFTIKMQSLSMNIQKK